MGTPIHRYNNKTFLIVDDFAQFRQSLKQMLLTIGANHITQAANASDAIDLYTEHQHDFLLIDFNLGEGLTGSQVLEQLTESEILKKDTIVILITAETSFNMVMGALEIRPDDYLAKPFTKSTLRTRLDRAFLRKQALRSILIALNQKQYKRAISLCEKLIKDKNPYALDCKRIQADLFLRLGAPDMAQRIFKELLALREMNWALLGLGKSYMFLGQYEKATASFDSIIEKNEYAIEAYDQKAEALLNIGDLDNASQVLKKACEISSISINRQRKLGSTALELLDIDLAVKAYRRCLSLTQHGDKLFDDYIFLIQALIFTIKEIKGPVGRRAIQEVSRLFKTCQSYFSEEAQSQIILSFGNVIYLYISGNKDAAQEQLQRTKQYLRQLKTSPNTLLLAQFKFAKRILPELEEVQVICDHYSKEEDVVYGNKLNEEGLTYYKNKEFTQAYELFRQAVKQAPHNINITLNLMQTILRLLQTQGMVQSLMETFQGCQKIGLQIKHTDQRNTHFQTLVKEIRAEIHATQSKIESGH